MALPDHYRTLNLTPSASTADVRRVYRELAKKFHPDKNPATAERFQAIRSAYEVLIDPVRRRQYDSLRRQERPYAPSYEFGKYSTSNAYESARKGQDAPEPPAKVPMWQLMIKPLVLILLAILLVWLISNPPLWLRELGIL